MKIGLILELMKSMRNISNHNGISNYKISFDLAVKGIIKMLYDL